MQVKRTRPGALWLPRGKLNCPQTARVCGVRSADTRADQRRRHQPAHARADGATDVVGADLCADAIADVIADISRRCEPRAFDAAEQSL